MIKICQHCGKNFESRANNAKYCPDCRREVQLEMQRRYYRQSIETRRLYRQTHREYFRDYQRRYRQKSNSSAITCKFCGKEFQRHGNSKYCSDECRRAYFAHLARQRRAATQKLLKCQRCGKEFEKLASNVKYCPECRPIVSSQQSRDYKARKRAARQPVKKTCERCGKPFEVFEDSRRRFCFECYRIKQIEHAAKLQAWLKVKPRVCTKCGREFTGMANQKICAECLAYQRRETRQRIQERYDHKKPKSTGKTLDDWAREADECNLDYGTYRALIAAGRTFEQLKAERRSPQTHSHCRHTYGF